jgi:hypothetical protein
MFLLPIALEVSVVDTYRTVCKFCRWTYGQGESLEAPPVANLLLFVGLGAFTVTLGSYLDLHTYVDYFVCPHHSISLAELPALPECVSGSFACRDETHHATTAGYVQGVPARRYCML